MMFRTVVAAVAATVLAAPVAGHTDQPAGDYIVVMRDDAATTPGAAAETARRLGSSVHFVYEHALRGYAGTLTHAALAHARRDPAVAFVEPDRQVETTGIVPQGNPPSWGLDRIDQRFLPLNRTYSFTGTAPLLPVYVIDSGIYYEHLDFQGRAIFGFDAFGGTGADCLGHGTHVAGTIGGLNFGVAKNVLLISVKIFDCAGNGTLAGLIAGVNWVTGNHIVGTPAVANMSLRVAGGSPALDTAVRNSILVDRISYAVAAGNSGADGGACLDSPARIAEVMTVGATASNDVRAGFSNFGGCVDWFAPGDGIVSAGTANTLAATSMNGTSMASPHTAGVAALYLQTNGGAFPGTVEAVLRSKTTQGVVAGAGPYANNDLLFTDF